MEINKYREDIDGLRAIAVLAVLFFHLDFGGVSGGFVGVDVFFVISGYLITKLIKDEVERSGGFQFKRFFIRRSRRLFPALFITIAVTFLFSWIVLSSLHLERFSLSSIASILSVSNVFFWNEAGYFDSDSHFKPLLHMWSLSVEEQFYLVWPLLLVLSLLKGGRFTALLMIVGVGCASLLLNFGYMDGGEGWRSTIFYLAPFRVFEFAIGGVLVWVASHQPSNPKLLEPLFLVGLIMIIYPMFVFTDKTLFPSYNALLPCVGAALVIYSGNAKYLGYLIRNKIVAGLGLISYSLYLVHWPLIVLGSVYLAREFVLIEKVVLCVVSIVIAYLMYRYVETPFRSRRGRKGVLKDRVFVLLCIVLSVMLIMVSFLTWKNDGWRVGLDDLVPLEASDKVDTWEMFSQYYDTKPPAGNKMKKVFFVGDSQAADMLNAFLATDLKNDWYISTQNVPVYCGFVYVHSKQRKEYFEKNTRAIKDKRPWEKICHRLMDKAFTHIANNDFDEIVVSSLWYGYQLPYFEQTVKILKNITDANITVVGNKNLLWSDDRNREAGSERIAEECYQTKKCNGVGGINVFSVPLFKGGEDEVIRRKWKDLSLLLGVSYLDMREVLCSQNYEFCSVYNENREPIYSDAGHFSNEGYKFVADLIYGEEMFFWKGNNP